MQRRDGREVLDEITLPARTESIPALVEFLSNEAWEGGFTDQKIHDVGLGVTEVLENIIRFACTEGTEQITIKCKFHDAPALIVDVIDSGKQFNMLVADAFPETQDFNGEGKVPSLKKLKKAIKNIEYRRDGELGKNILTFIIPR